MAQQRSALVLTLIGLLAATLSGCGSKAPAAPTPSTPTSQTFTGTFPVPASQADQLQFQDITASLTGTMVASVTFTTIGDPNPLDQGVLVWITGTSCTLALQIAGTSNLCNYFAPTLCEAGPPVKCPPLTAQAGAPISKGQTARVWVGNGITAKSYTLTVTVHF
jgi:hypothetical protein